MELLTQYSSELIKLIIVGGIVGGTLVFALGKILDSEKTDGKETRIFMREKTWEEMKNE